MAKFPSYMESLMDSNADPCTDFYQYSCGGWMKTHALKESDEILKVTDYMFDHNAALIKEIAREKHPIVSELWDSCMNMETITQLGHQPLEKDLQRIVETKTKENLVRLAGEFYRTGANSFLKLTTARDGMTQTINVESAETPLPSNFYSGLDATWISDDYIQYINELLDVSKFMSLKTKFEDEFFYSLLSKKTIIDYSYSLLSNFKTIPWVGKEPNAGEIVFRMEKKLVPWRIESTTRTKISITGAIKRWPMAFGAFWQGAVSPSNVHVKQDTNVFMNERYLNHLEELIESTSIEDLKFYVAFIMVHSRVHWLGNSFYSRWFKLFGQKLSKMQEPPERDAICEESLFAYIPDLIGKYFYDKTMDRNNKEYALEMIELIKQAMRKRLSRAKWLDTQHQELYQVKLQHLIPLVGYSKAKTYPSHLSRHDYPMNIYTTMSHLFDHDLKKIGHPVIRDEWDEFSTHVNAFYQSDRNAILIPSSILQPPYFNGTNVHPANNFGAIGMVMGHEITHGFDSTRIDLDEHGKERTWSMTTSMAFQERTKCFIQQYSAIEIQGQDGMGIGNVQGTWTKDENIADNGGLTLAWDAYRRYMNKHKAIYQGISKTEGDKMFFIAFGQAWCEKANDHVAKQLLKEDTHSPGPARVNGVVMNHKQFAKVFDCKPNTQMNPIKKCKLW